MVEWLKQPGDPVAGGDIVAVVETQKGAIEIEVFEAGTFDRLPGRRSVRPYRSGRRWPSSTEAIGRLSQLRLHRRWCRDRPRRRPPWHRGSRPVEGLKVSPAARQLAAERGIDVTP